MRSRFNSLKVRTALALAAVLVLLLLLNAAILIPRAWREQRQGIESTARVYARLTTMVGDGLSYCPQPRNGELICDDASPT